MPGKITRDSRAYSLLAGCFGIFAAVVSAQQIGLSAAPRGVVAAVSPSDPLPSGAHPPGLPLLSSNPGAAYTIYLDFGGFTFTGTWGGGATNGTPGTTLAYDSDGDPTTYVSAEVTNIKNVWARTAQKYAGFNINVTTVDPAVAAGQAGSDFTRQGYYDSIAKMMHTVIGGSGGWSGGGGVSYVGVTKNSYSAAGINSGAGPGYHTNWVFSALSPNGSQFMAEASAHENGHGFNLAHQSDFTGGTLVNEYSTNNTATGSGSYAPIMGDSYSVQRGTWRSGKIDSGNGVLGSQNDVKTIVNNPGMIYTDDVVGHNKITATALPLVGSSVDPNLARGWITPVSIGSPNPIGAGNYTTDFFSFASDGINAISLKVTDGTEFVNVGTADPGATLNSTLQILDATGVPVVGGINVAAANTLSETFTGILSAGLYYAQVSSAGGYTSTFDTGAQYFDMGAYFLTGTGFVPEPAAMAVIISLGGLMLRRRVA